MTWQIAAGMNVIIAVAYLLISATILRGLLFTAQLRTNRLAVATAAIFFTCAVHHGAHTVHMLLPLAGVDVAQGIALREAFGWQSAVWDAIGAVVAVYYLSLRHSYAMLLSTPAMFEDQVRGQAAAVVARERELLSDAEELAGAGSFQWDVTRGLMAWSPGMYRVHGLPPRAAITLSEASSEAASCLQADDREEAVDRVREALGGAATRVDHRYRIVRPDAAVRRVETRARIERDAAGAPVRVVGVTVDLTERLESVEAQASGERRLREATEAIIEASSGAFVSTDHRGRITGWNHQAESLLGWPRAEALGRSLVDTIISPTQRPAHRIDLDRFVLTGASRLVGGPVEVSAVHRSGRELPVELVMWPSYAGTEVTFNAFLQDITARRQVQDELAIGRDQALDASRQKSDFLANMSHEIRTPMNGVIGMTELLLGSELTGRQREYAEVINSSGEALLTIIDQILDFSKVEAGKLELENREFDLRETVAAVCELLAPRAHGKGVELAWLVEGDVPGPVIGDAGRLRQVLTNLVDNAVKFTSIGEVIVTVRAARRPGMIDFRVADTGGGIEPGRLEALFEPFVQADATTTRRFGGTGLGLPISRRLVRLMGGEVTAESRPGRGSTFSFTVRLAGAGDLAGGPGPDVVDAPAGRVAPAGPSARSTLRVLVVDDNATNLQILCTHLAGLDDALVSTAPGGARALQMLWAAADDDAPFDLVILDAKMPGVSGMEVARTVRGDPCLDGAALLMLSSTGSPPPGGEVARCVHVNKPVRRARLLEAIAQATETRSPPAPVIAAEPAPADTARAAPARILLVEDNQVNQMLTIEMLTQRGHLVDLAETGRQAVSAWEANRYQLVLMDCQMPELDGYEATAEIRRRESGRPAGRVPIVAMTANSVHGARETCLAAGMDDYLPKPFRLAELDAILEHWLPSAAAGTPAELVDPASLGALGSDAESLAFQRELVELFRTDSAARLADMSDALAREDGERVSRTAHAIRGAGEMIGATAVSAICAEIEHECLGADPTGVAVLVGRLEDAVALTTAQLHELLA